MLHPVIFLFLGMAAMFAGTHLLALEAKLYYYLWWFDVVMHAWGGFLIVFGLVALSTLRGVRRFFVLSPAFVAMILIGVMVLWEVFEYTIGASLREDFWIDTLYDLVLGMAGGLIAAVLLWSRSNGLRS